MIIIYLINKHFHEAAFFGFATPYPGTELEKRAEDLKINIKITSWRLYNANLPIFETDLVSIDFLNHLNWEYETNKDVFIEKLLNQTEFKIFYKFTESRLKRSKNNMNKCHILK